MITFGSLFAGIGGLDLGFERAGMTCRWQVEIDDYATKVLAKHWPNVHRERDIRECGAHNLERVDVICGGFPCQDISYAGLGAGLDGERSGLFFEAIRVVRELRPRVLVLENVAALLTRGLDRVLGTLAEVGYDAEWHCIPAAYVGAPHIRDRAFVLAYAEHWRLSERRRVALFATTDRPAQVSRDDRASMRIQASAIHADTDSGRLQEREERDSKSDKRLEPQQWDDAMRFCSRGWWEVEPNVGRVVDGTANRVDRLRCLGNAVVPQVAEYVGRRVLEVLF